MMEIKNITCIECPRGCRLSVEIEGGRALKVSGNGCPKGEKYGAAEATGPERILTSSVLSCGLELKMVPVRTGRPVPKKDLLKAMKEIKKIRLKTPVKCGDVVAPDLAGLGVELIATREAGKNEL
jgi:CxxC motif-containing protein